MTTLAQRQDTIPLDGGFTKQFQIGSQAGEVLAISLRMTTLREPVHRSPYIRTMSPSAGG